MTRSALLLAILAPLSAGAIGEPTVRPEVEATLAWAPAAPEAGPPMSLTASDGTGLRLVALQADALVTDPLAFTELRLTFENPEDRVREGRFEITLPPGAAISRFAMKINGEWQEGEVLEKQRARRVYEDFLHRRQDPALLETDAGNQFRARVFPIPAGGVKELLISYSQELTGADEPWQLPLQGLPKLDQLDVNVSVDRFTGPPRVYAAHHKDLVPEADLALSMAEEQVDVGLRHGNLAIARVRPYLDLPPAELDGLTVLVDTSASRMLGFDGHLDRVEAVMEAVAGQSGNIPIQVLAFDQTISPIYRGSIDGYSAASAAIEQRDALGASDLGSTFKALAGLSPHDRVLLVTDGIFTAGETEADDLHAALKSLDIERLDVLVDGGIRDEDALHALVTAGLPQAGLVLEADAPAAETAARLAEATRSGIGVHVPGAEWVWPTTLDGVQSGDDTLIYAWIPEDAPMMVQLDGASVEGPIRFADAPEPLLERAVMGANIARLTDLRSVTADDDEKAAIRDDIIDLSVAHRVLSDFTALLVLETEEDYARYDIDRNALADILTISDHRIQVLTRADAVTLGARAEPTPDDLPKKESKKQGEIDLTLADEGNLDNTGAISPDDLAAGSEIDGRGPTSMDAPASISRDVVSQAPAQEQSIEGMFRQDSLEDDQFADAVVEDMEEEEAEMDMRPMEEERRAAGAVSSRSFSAEVAAADEIAISSSSSPIDRARQVVSGFGAETAGMAVPEPEPAAKPKKGDAWNGRFDTVMRHIDKGDTADALAEVGAWRAGDPSDVLGLLALGEVFEAQGRPEDAARAYGSIIDLFPSRADLRRMAGQRLERLSVAGELAQDTYRVSVEQRPDHPSSHRLYAMSLARAGKLAEAFEALKVGLSQEYPGRFPGVVEIMREDLSIVGAALILKDPTMEKTVRQALSDFSTALPAGPTTRLVLHWETDANDVDFHIYDRRGGHAWYSSKELPSGGRLYADVTQGYGPECFTVASPRAYPYTVQAHYYRRGPMGYGMGTLQIIEHDGHGNLAFEDRPFVIMNDDATVDLGSLEGPLLKKTASR